MHMAERCIYEHRPMGLSLYLKLLIELSDFKKLYRSLVWAFPASLNVG